MGTICISWLVRDVLPGNPMESKKKPDYFSINILASVKFLDFLFCYVTYICFLKKQLQVLKKGIRNGVELKQEYISHLGDVFSFIT